MDVRDLDPGNVRAARRYEAERGHAPTCTTVVYPDHPFEGCNCIIADIERGCMGDVVAAMLRPPMRPSAAPLPLTRPLVSLDTETTGTDVATDRIIELGLVHLHPDGTRSRTRLMFYPGGPIPASATAVHHITDADVAGELSFAAHAEAIAQLLTDVDLCGYNLRAFDLPILRAEFQRAGVAWPCPHARVVDALVIYRDREPRTLDRAVPFYCGRHHDGAHRAEADAEATLDVLLAQVERYELPTDLGDLDQASGGRRPDWASECGRIRWNHDGDAVLAFGKAKGNRLIDERGFAAWVLRNDFPADVKDLCRAVIGGDRPRVPATRTKPKKESKAAKVAVPAPEEPAPQANLAPLHYWLLDSDWQHIRPELYAHLANVLCYRAAGSIYRRIGPLSPEQSEGFAADLHTYHPTFVVHREEPPAPAPPPPATHIYRLGENVLTALREVRVEFDADIGWIARGTRGGPFTEEVDRVLRDLGGGWAGKIRAHAFPADPTAAIAAVLESGGVSIAAPKAVA